MAFDFHTNRDLYFQLQYSNTKNNILPFIERKKKIEKGMKVLEIGCRDGGVLLPFLELDCYITGFDLEVSTVEKAKEIYAKDIQTGRANFFIKNVHDYIAEFKGIEENKFDIIILKDVIEHVYGHQEMIHGIKSIMKKNGVIYFGFPPWQNPYGGHQQVLKSKILALMPYYHLLPNFLYYGIIKIFAPKSVDFIKMTKETRITPESFEKIIKEESLNILERDFWLINPMYEFKFNIKPKLQFKWLENIRYIRNYFTTTCDYLIGL
jgi:2-polyprenyl-3-methyl-5-hydroxy-6-metoxy-1,4-benzoquinol methylase